MSEHQQQYPAVWNGWQRLPGQRWQKVCQATTEDECRELLFNVRFPGNRRDVMVLPAASGDPNRRFKL